MRRQSHDPDRLFRKRQAAGLTMPQLAERAGVALGTVSHAESGQNVSIKTLHLLAQALECEVTELLPAEPETSRA